MKKSLLYSCLIAVFSIVASGCTETAPGNVGSEESLNYLDGDKINNRAAVDVSRAYITRDAATNSRVSGNTATPIAPLFGHEALSPSHVRGARIYDDFIIELAMTGTPTPNPLAALAEGGLVAADEWRCSGCHGFDYEGVTTFNGGAEVNLQDLIPVRHRDEEFVIHMLQDGFMLSDGSVVHSYAGILDAQAIVDVADFVVNEIYDVHEVLSAATGVALGDMMEGANMYNNDGLPIATGVPEFIRADGTGFGCGLCHDDQVMFPTAPPMADLKASAVADPFKFLHRINFGSPRDKVAFGFGYGEPSVMPGLYEVILTDGLHFGGSHQASAVMRYIQLTP